MARDGQSKERREVGQASKPVDNAIDNAIDGAIDGSIIGKQVGQTEEEKADVKAGASASKPNDVRSMPGNGVARSDVMPWFPDFFQVWDEPFAMMRRLSEEMDQMVEKFLGFPARAASRQQTPPSNWTPLVDVTQAEDRLVISAELPGVRRHDVHVEVRSDRVTVEGERRQQWEEADRQLHRSERCYGYFYRVIALPEGADPNTASATMHDGVLEITVPVAKGGRHGRKLDIQVR
jgi:HSP20 family molecular chaperone IbpA